MLRNDLALRVSTDILNLELVALREPGSKKRALLAAAASSGPVAPASSRSATGPVTDRDYPDVVESEDRDGGP